LTVWLLGDSPVIEFDDGSVGVLAGNTYDVDVSGINVFLNGNFTSGGIDDEITNCVISTAALLL
jgi:hypothetical protein